jgi:hypothetical protein
MTKMNKPQLETLGYVPECEFCAEHLDKSKALEPEQPNSNAIIVKTIQQLMHVVTNELEKLDCISPESKQNDEQLRINARMKALEDIDKFERTTLFELQKAFE